ncbi:uncharacterized protein LY89DRAFT_789794 [Mollisia scopiformis]|uniref:Zn(2)-C6 fungal-type domain-containing protein n=1 Tax=Mollisia scopiformis TaxID=149040 RepID=A0A132B6N5_MOLSC|nr:uncharacterized protein LY89DRAFT_789794 [Mollisia scopiformis]KUJ07337.1 hypothetical protein LY89DRAFT_789794 [Mollisia scopiformis]
MPVRRRASNPCEACRIRKKRCADDQNPCGFCAGRRQPCLRSPVPEPGKRTAFTVPHLTRPAMRATELLFLPPIHKLCELVLQEEQIRSDRYALEAETQCIVAGRPMQLDPRLYLPDCSADTVHRLVIDNYRDCISTRQPLLPWVDIDRLVHAFLEHSHPLFDGRDIGTAIVLLMMALGEAYQYQDTVSGQNDLPSSVYFMEGMTILDEQHAAYTLEHIQGYLLASLCHSQCGHTLESFKYTSNACQGLLFISQPALEGYQMNKQTGAAGNAADNPYLFAFWTCIQMESGILLELPCPPTGLLRFYEHTPFPHLEDMDYGLSPPNIRYLEKQYSLIKHTARLVLAPDAFLSPEYLQTTRKTRDVLDSILRSDGGVERGSLPARYHSIEVILYRQYVLNILLSHDQTSASLLKDRHTKDQTRKGISALIDSASVSNSCLGNQVMENQWMRAQSQWGNMLVLLAAFSNPTLQPMVLDIIAKEDLARLIQVSSVLNAGLASPTLQVESKILQHLSRSLRMGGADR